MGAFQSGFSQGGDLANQAIRNAMYERELAIKEAADRRAAAEFERQQKVWSDTDAAMANFNNVAGGIDKPTQLGIQNTYGMNSAQVASALRDGGVPGLQAKLAGYGQPDSYDLQNAPGGLQPGRFDPSQLKAVQASPLDMQRALLGVATASGDRQALAGIVDKLNVLQGQQESRDFLAKGKALFEGRNASPEAMQAWRDWVTPHTSMATKYSGLEADYRVNPKTGVIEEIPYKPGSKVVERSFDEVAPYMLQTQKLISLYGDPQTAADALNKMSADERARVLADNTTRLGIRDKISNSVHRANTDENGRITANAAALNAKTNSELRAEQIKTIRAATEGRENALLILDKWDKLTPEQQMGAEGDALLREFNINNVKAGGQISLGPKGGKGAGASKRIIDEPVDIKKNDDGTYTAYSKDGGLARYNMINGEAIPLGMDAQTYAANKKAAMDNGVKLIIGENNGRLELKYQGADGQFYDDPKQARYAKTNNPAPAQAGGLRTPGNDMPVSTPGEITTSINPQTKQKTFVVQGLRKRFATREEAEAAARTVPGQSGMSASLNRYGD